MKNRLNKIQHWMWIRAALFLYDFLMTYVAYIGALWIRFDFKFDQIPETYMDVAASSLWIIAILSIVCAYFLNLYNFIWRFASVGELLRCLTTTTINVLVCFIVTQIFFDRMPVSYYFIGFILQFAFFTLIRFSYRIILSYKSWKRHHNEQSGIMIVGAGDAGTLVIKELNNTSADDKERVVCLIDDNPNKWGRFIMGVPVVGGRNDIAKNVEKFNIGKIIIALPSAKKENINEIVKIASNTKVDVKIMPSISRFAKEDLTISNLKNVEITDLLGRDEIKTDLEEVFKFIKNKTVLVTGAGGSIGSELVRQIAANNPKTLVLFDIYENSTYYLELQLKKKFPDLHLVTLIGSVRDQKKVNDLFNTYKPDIVYHAAAHKHVPLMEDSPNEAIKNNAFGTLNVAFGAMLNNTERFVLISTDKAVNPTNVMGASKRICEMLIQDFNKCINNNSFDKLTELYKDLYDIDIKLPKQIDTVFSAVRFGNVLGSNGSVIPIFKEQIEKGGPVTVTDPEINRYFMTIPEAVALVLQASVYALGGEIFVLDMGEPIKIVDLAKKMIELSGKKDSIKIVYTGLRPGEKLYEERLMDEEGLRETPNNLISMAKPLDIKTTQFFNALVRLYKKSNGNEKDINKEISKLVKTYDGIAK